MRSPGARKWGSVPSASPQTSARCSGNQSATSRQRRVSATVTTSNGECGTPNMGTLKWRTPSRSASASQSRLWRSMSWTTARSSPRRLARSIASGTSTGSTSQTPPSAASAWDVRWSSSSSTSQPKPKSSSSQKRKSTSILGSPAGERQGEPQEPEEGARARGDDRRGVDLEEEVGDEEDRPGHRERQEADPRDREAVGDPEERLLVALPPADAVIGGRRHQQRQACEREQKRDEVDVLLQVGDALEAVGERHRQEEGEQDLNARERDAELVEELDQLTVEPGLLVLRHAREPSREDGARERRARTSAARVGRRPGPAAPVRALVLRRTVGGHPGARGDGGCDGERGSGTVGADGVAARVRRVRLRLLHELRKQESARPGGERACRLALLVGRRRPAGPDRGSCRARRAGGVGGVLSFTAARPPGGSVGVAPKRADSRPRRAAGGCSGGRAPLRGRRSRAAAELGRLPRRAVCVRVLAAPRGPSPR